MNNQKNNLCPNCGAIMKKMNMGLEKNGIFNNIIILGLAVIMCVIPFVQIFGFLLLIVTVLSMVGSGIKHMFKKSDSQQYEAVYYCPKCKKKQYIVKDNRN